MQLAYYLCYEQARSVEKINFHVSPASNTKVTECTPCVKHVIFHRLDHWFHDSMKPTTMTEENTTDSPLTSLFNAFLAPFSATLPNEDEASNNRKAKVKNKKCSLILTGGIE